MALTKRTRYEVLRRDNHTCRYCGGRAPDVALTVDHVTPSALGGTDLPENLVAACKDCNSGKASTSPTDTLVADVRQVDVQWAAAIKRVTASRARQTKRREAYVDQFDALWASWWYGPDKKPIPRPTGWEASIERYYELGVPVDEMLRLARTALGREKVLASETFRYFAGCVWRYIDEVQQAARDLLATEEDGDV